MPHLLLIIEPPAQRATRSLAEGQEAYARMLAFGDSLSERGLLLASQSLTSHHDASRVRLRDGKAQVVDGPFADANEMVGGYYLLATDNRDQALQIAAECPAAAWCTVELRTLGPYFAGASL